MFTAIQEFFFNIRTQKLRAFLTMFGIVWGTVAIVVLLAFGEGFKKQTAKNMHGMGEQIVVVFGSRTTKSYAGFNIGRRIRLHEEDARMLEQRIPAIAVATAEYQETTTNAVHGANVMKPGITGVEVSYSDMRNVYVEQGGRWLNSMDIQEQRRVVILGDRAKQLLFGAENAVGKTVMLGASPFLVIGVMQKKIQNSNYGTPDEERAFIPITTYRTMFPAAYVNNMLYRLKNPLEAESVKAQFYEVMAAKYRFDPTDKEAVFLWDTAEMDKFVFYFFLGLNVFLGIVGTFTLAVGGLGVANIMFVVVQERIREIGIRRAVGAHRTTILLQFLAEAILVVMAGAFIGFLIALGIIKLLAMLPIQDAVGTPDLSWSVALIAVGLLMAIGVAAGFFPARRAAYLDVVECLRT
ncbi:MAG: ABC transporter permease [Candidatus Kapabacteria bacterium]|nr:ABC transporter permease [Candidatus Kapabacteria bacterium]